MATALAQRKWRARNKWVKRQLNVMARQSVHDDLDGLAQRFELRGKGEAVTFAAFLARALMQRAEFSDDAQRILDDTAAAYHRDRDLYIN